MWPIKSPSCSRFGLVIGYHTEPLMRQGIPEPNFEVNNEFAAPDPYLAGDPNKWPGSTRNHAACRVRENLRYVVKGTKAVGLFESWSENEMSAECLRELGCERTQPQVWRRVKQLAV